MHAYKDAKTDFNLSLIVVAAFSLIIFAFCI